MDSMEVTYTGIQDRSPKWVIFSIWDKTSMDDNPYAPSDDLVKKLAQGEDVTGEGTGGQKSPCLWLEGGSHINLWSTFDQTQKKVRRPYLQDGS